MTLTEAATITNKGIKYFGIPVIIIMVVWFFVGLLRAPADLPENYITPDYMCGQLPIIEIPSLENDSKATFSIETTSGAIPDLPKVVNVFSYNHPGQSLLALEESQRTAEIIGFDPINFTRISTTEYRWYDAAEKRTLIIETSNQNLSMTTDFSDTSVDTHPRFLPSEDNAKTVTLQYLQNMSLLYKDYSKGTQKTYLIQITPTGEFREAPSLSEADLVRVDFFRDEDLITIDPSLTGAAELGSTLSQQLENQKATTIETETAGSVEVKKYSTKIFNESPIFGNITVYVGGMKSELDRSYDIFGIEYKNWFLANLPCGTYKLISPQEAVNKVQDGTASLAYLMEKNTDRIIPYETKSVQQMTILEVSLAYWEPAARQQYLQPIFVIRGEADFGSDVYGEFYYYVPAIDYESIPADAGVVKEVSTEEPAQ